jgi:TolB protein
MIVYATTEGVIRIHELSSGNERVLDTGKGVSVQPAFAPSGKEIIYVRFSETVPDDTDLYIIDSETKKSIPFLGQTSQQFYPACSLDGERLAYVNVHCSDPCGRLIQEVWTADRFGKNARQLLLTNSTCEKPSWSPDVRRLAFSSDMNGNFDIYIYELDSGQLRQVTKDPGLDTSPAWSPDGSRLAFVSTRSGLSEIWIHDFASGNDKKLDPFPGKRVPCKDVAW